jgi:N utilization substance protein B
MGRRLARELAMKILYRHEEGETDVDKIMDAILETKTYTDEDKSFTRQLVAQTLDNIGEIDTRIKGVLQNWPLDRISIIDKTILRLGTCEILYFEDIPAQVSINEAIEIGKKYGGNDSGRFVNGILDAVKKNHESRHNK